MFSWIADKVKDVLGIHELYLHADQESTTDPGTLVIRSDPLDGLSPPISGKSLLEETANSLRRPVDPMTEFVLKECAVEEHGPGSFTVKVTVDGQKLKGFGYGRDDGCDRVKSWKRVDLDINSLTLTTQDYVNEAEMGCWADECQQDVVHATFNMKVVPDPERVEMFLVAKDGSRVADATFMGYMYTWLDPIIKGLRSEMSAKVLVAVGPSLKDATQKSVVTDPLDEFTDYDTFFEGTLTKAKEFFRKMESTEVEESDTELVARSTMMAPSGSEGEAEIAKVTTSRLTWSHENGDIMVVVEHPDGASTKDQRILHKSPLRLEAWKINHKGERTTEHSYVKRVRMQVNELL